MDPNIKAFASFSIKDPEKAREFYGSTLGLPVKEIPMGETTLLELDLNGATFLLYEKEDHTPSSYTVLNLEVKDIVQAVAELSSKGIRFERYEGTDELGINRNEGGPVIAWFKDPDGNFISLIEAEKSVGTSKVEIRTESLEVRKGSPEGPQ